MKGKNLWLKAKELEDARRRLIYLVQQKEMKPLLTLIKKTPQRVKPPLSGLNPHIATDGVAVISGRLTSNGRERTKPIIPPGYLAKLIVREMHEKTLCGTDAEIVSNLSLSYEVLKLKDTIKLIKETCPVCIRYRGKPHRQQMGRIPIFRSVMSPPFSKIIIDYAGHFELVSSKIVRERPYKAWVMVVVCMSTKAVHLELVGDCSGVTCLDALIRVFSTRGTPTLIISDNGTNFVYVENVIQELVKRQQAKAEEYTEGNGIRWQKAPPYAPNFNGLVEANVKCVKRHLVPQLRKIKNTFEEVNTLLKRVEGILNTRPLCRYGEDYLTPGHFFVCRHLNSLPDVEVEQANVAVSYGRIVRAQKEFWDSWIKEYVPKLDTRPKWKVARKNIKKGDVVIISDDFRAPGQWPMGRVEEVIPGKDGLVRVCRIRTNMKTKIIERSARCLKVLPIQPELEDQMEYVKGIEDLESDPKKVGMHTSEEMEQEENVCHVLVGEELGKREEPEKKRPRYMDLGSGEEWVAKPPDVFYEPPPGIVYRRHPREWLQGIMYSKRL